MEGLILLAFQNMTVNDEEEKEYYLLSGDPEKNKYEVIKLNNQFEVIKRFPLNTVDKIPTDLVLKFVHLFLKSNGH